MIRRAVALSCIVGLFCAAGAIQAKAQTTESGGLMVSRDSIYDTAFRFSMENPSGAFAVDGRATDAARQRLNRNSAFRASTFFMWILTTGGAAKSGGIDVFVPQKLDQDAFRNYVAGLRDSVLKRRKPTPPTMHWTKNGGEYHFAAKLENGVQFVSECITTVKNPKPAIVCAWLAGPDEHAMRATTRTLRAW